MAKREVVLCDICGEPGRTFVLYADGDMTARSVDLCETHSTPVVVTFASGSVVDLPTRPRVRMEPTALKTTARTRPLKTTGGQDGTTDARE